MNEQEWFRSDQPIPLLTQIRGIPSDRKLRLFACACCRRKWKFFNDDRCREAVEIAELYADDPDRIGDLDWAAQGARLAFNEWRPKQGSQGILVRASGAVLALVRSRHNYAAAAEVATAVLGIPIKSARARAAESREQSSLLRDIFGNPFRPIAFDPAWRSGTAVGIAAGIYEDRAFERMPILADALQEAGCEHADILTHCREPGTHVRGCWVVDLVLGKE